MAHIDADKLIAEIERWRDKAKEKYNKNPYCMGRCDALAEFRNHIVSLLEEQPDNEDIDKVAQELYEHLYELKRRNNVPTNLYDKQEIINLWKAGIEYGRSHPNQVHFVDAGKMGPEVDLEKAAEQYSQNILAGGEDMFDAIADGFIAGAKWIEEQMKKNAGGCLPQEYPPIFILTKSEVR